MPHVLADVIPLQQTSEDSCCHLRSNGFGVLVRTLVADQVRDVALSPSLRADQILPGQSLSMSVFFLLSHFYSLKEFYVVRQQEALGHHHQNRGMWNGLDYSLCPATRLPKTVSEAV